MPVGYESVGDPTFACLFSITILLVKIRYSKYLLSVNYPNYLPLSSFPMKSSWILVDLSFLQRDIVYRIKQGEIGRLSFFDGWQGNPKILRGFVLHNVIQRSTLRCLLHLPHQPNHSVARVFKIHMFCCPTPGVK